MNFIHPELGDVVAWEISSQRQTVWIPAWVMRSPTRYEQWREGGWGNGTHPFWER